jgi:hypothetical protein
MKRTCGQISYMVYLAIRHVNEAFLDLPTWLSHQLNAVEGQNMNRRTTPLGPVCILNHQNLRFLFKLINFITMDN